MTENWLIDNHFHLQAFLKLNLPHRRLPIGLDYEF
jgi:hypothetical protein